MAKANGYWELGDNVKGSIDAEGILTLKIDTKHRRGISDSLKSRGVASTLGNQQMPGCPPTLKLGVNLFDMNVGEVSEAEIGVWAQKQAVKDQAASATAKRQEMAAKARAKAIGTYTHPSAR